MTASGGTAAAPAAGVVATEPRAVAVRRTGMRSWLPGVLVVGVLSACSVTVSTGASNTVPGGSASATDTAVVSGAVVACGPRDVAATVDADLTIRVVNTSTAPCTIAGDPPVILMAGRVDRATPDPTSVVLAAGAAYVQPVEQVAGESACDQPISSGGPGTGYWTVTVNAFVLHPPGSAQLGRLIVNCGVVRFPAGHVEAAPVATGTLQGHLLQGGGPPPGTPRAVDGTVTVEGAGVHRVLDVGLDGAFSVVVPPGRYTVVGTSPGFDDGTAPCPADGATIVTAGTVTTVDPTCHMR
jgi:hypothetical protein